MTDPNEFDVSASVHDESFQVGVVTAVTEHFEVQTENAVDSCSDVEELHEFGTLHSGGEDDKCVHIDAPPIANVRKESSVHYICSWFWFGSVSQALIRHFAMALVEGEQNALRCFGSVQRTSAAGFLSPGTLAGAAPPMHGDIAKIGHFGCRRRRWRPILGDKGVFFFLGSLGGLLG